MRCNPADVFPANLEYETDGKRFQMDWYSWVQAYKPP